MVKKIVLIFVSAIGLLLPQITPAQGTLYVSNLGQTPTGSNAIGSDSWIAQGFITGTNSNGYTLNSIQLLMDANSGSPSNLAVSIYSSLSGNPNNNLGNLVGSDPLAGGIFTYTASGITLSQSTFYFVVLTAATTIAQGAYNWSATTGGPQGGVGGWDIFGEYFSSTDGLSWQASRENNFQFGIYAMPVPEPSTYALAGLGLLSLSLLKWKFRSKNNSHFSH
jgi:hypothetical protein